MSSIEVDEALLLYAARYALGRRTFSVADVCNEIVAHAKRLHGTLRLTLAQEIKEALLEGHAGDKCDRERWEAALEALIREADRG